LPYIANPNFLSPDGAASETQPTLSLAHAKLETFGSYGAGDHAACLDAATRFSLNERFGFNEIKNVFVLESDVEFSQQRQIFVLERILLSRIYKHCAPTEREEPYSTTTDQTEERFTSNPSAIIASPESP
jgi:hypothetical protein